MPNRSAATARAAVAARLRGVAALLALVALIGGVPVLLGRVVGRPWPQPFPPLEVIWRSLRSGNISDGAVLKALAVVMWIAWARLAISVGVEVIARVAGIHVPRVIGLGRAQHWAAALVASVVLVVGVSPHPSAAAPWSPGIPMPRPIAAGLLEHHTAPAASPIRVSADRGRIRWEAPTPVPRATLHVVQRHESFWSIAEDALGDGSRWREIVALNAGREVAPGVVFSGTPDRLLPGWALLVPDEATPTNGVSATTNTGTADAHTVVVTPGDTLSGIAEHELGDAAEWPRVWEANHDRRFGNRVFDDPNLILPGWELIIPDVVAPSLSPPAAPVADVPPADAPASAPLEQPTVAPDDSHVEVDSPDAMPPVTMPPVTMPPDAMPPDTSRAELPTTDGAGLDAIVAPGVVGDGVAAVAGVGGAVLLAAGVAGAVEARRRRRLRAATVHARLAVPAPPLADLERLVRTLDAGERIARLDIALRAVGYALFSTAPGAGVLGAIDTDDGTLDVLLDRPVAVAPAPWTSVTAHRWRLPADVGIVDIAAAARRAQQPCPALVHLGGTPLDGGLVGQLYLDLEAVGLLAVDAPAPTAAAIVRAVTAGLAVSPLAESVQLITCGLGTVHLGHPMVEHPSSLAVALEAAKRAVGATSALTAGLSTFVLRSRQVGGEAWEPAIVAAAAGADDEPCVFDLADEDICAAGRGGQGIGIVVGRAVAGAGWTLGVHGQRWIVQPLGLEVMPVGVSPGELGDLQRLIDQADAIVVEAPLVEEPPIDQIEVGAEPDHSAPAALGWSLMVRVLGSVEVVDQAYQPAVFERSKALELVVWMSQHRDRSTRMGARTALWETTVRDTTFANVVSDARRSLARLLVPADGEEWIGRTLTDDLPLHPGVVTDADVLTNCVCRAASATPADATRMLRSALGLVRDMPFAGTAYLWPDAEGTTSALILLVTSAATQLAGLYLTEGDVAGVFWATGQGLKVLPGHEELISLRMRAHGRQGDLAGVRHEWEAYERVLDADTWSDGAAPSPKLVALRRELLAPSLTDA